MREDEPVRLNGYCTTPVHWGSAVSTLRVAGASVTPSSVFPRDVSSHLRLSSCLGTFRLSLDVDAGGRRWRNHANSAMSGASFALDPKTQPENTGGERRQLRFCELQGDCPRSCPTISANTFHLLAFRRACQVGSECWSDEGIGRKCVRRVGELRQLPCYCKTVVARPEPWERMYFQHLVVRHTSESQNRASMCGAVLGTTAKMC